MHKNNRQKYLEKKFVVPTIDGASIHGYFNQVAEKKSGDRLVVLSHGLTGNPNEYLLKQAQRYFNASGYDVVRFSYYAAEAGGRKLKDCTLRIHAEDLNAVCDHFRPNYKNLYVAGHSYGGLTMLFARPEANAYSFWDSAFVPYEGLWKEGAEFSPALDGYLLHWSSDHVIGKAMVEEAKALTSNKARELAAAVRVPSQVVIAGADASNLPRDGLHAALKCEKLHLAFAKADHGFSAGESIFDLLDASRLWFEKYAAADKIKKQSSS